MSSEPAHDGEVAQDVVGHAEEAVAVLRRPRALVRALPARVGVKYHAVHVPHLDAGNLIHWQAGDGQTLEMHGVPVRVSTCVHCLVHVLEQDAVRRCQRWLHIAQYSTKEKEKIDDEKIIKQIKQLQESREERNAVSEHSCSHPLTNALKSINIYCC